MIVALVVVGMTCQALAWRLVARGVLGIWVAMSAVLGFVGVASLLTGRVAMSARVDPWLAAGVGLGAGALLYAATWGFVRIVGRLWGSFARHASAIYGPRQDLSLAAALLLGVGCNVVGEELFWRGLVLGRAALDEGTIAGSILAWTAYVSVNLFSGSLAIVAGAVVGGAAWVALGAWAGGVLAPMLCHAVWTGCMIAFPPVRIEGRGG